MIEKQALEFIDTISVHTTAGSMLDAMARALKGVGIDMFCLNLVTTPTQAFSEVLLASKLPSEWLQLYEMKNYARHDPSQRYGKRVVTPYEWKDAPYDPECEPAVLEVVCRASDFGIGNGFVVPIPSSAGNVGNFWMGGYNFQLSKQLRPLLHMMALYAFAHVQRLEGTHKPNLPLTHREREILTWVAAGKSIVEIGEILNISDRTVEWHVANAIARLGARTRSNAVAVALRDGLIAF
jgi:DNA-binding CsgD family transcriptional regulator